MKLFNWLRRGIKPTEKLTIGDMADMSMKAVGREDSATAFGGERNGVGYIALIVTGHDVDRVRDDFQAITGCTQRISIAPVETDDESGAAFKVTILGKQEFVFNVGSEALKLLPNFDDPEGLLARMIIDGSMNNLEPHARAAARRALVVMS